MQDTMAPPQSLEAQLADLLKRSEWADKFHSDVHAQLRKLRDEPSTRSGLADRLDTLVQKIHTRGDPWLPDIAERAADVTHTHRREQLQQQAAELAEQHKHHQAEHDSEMARLRNEMESTKAKVEEEYREKQSRLQLEHDAGRQALQNEHERVAAALQREAQEVEASLKRTLQSKHDQVVAEVRQKAENAEASLKSTLQKEHDREVARLREEAAKAKALLNESLQAEHDRVVVGLQEQASTSEAAFKRQYQENHNRRTSELADERRRTEQELESQRSSLRQRETNLQTHANSLQERELTLQRNEEALSHKERVLTQRQEADTKLIAERRASQSREHLIRTSALQRERAEFEENKAQWQRHLDGQLTQQQAKTEHTLDGVQTLDALQQSVTSVVAAAHHVSERVEAQETNLQMTSDSMFGMEQSIHSQSQSLATLQNAVEFAVQAVQEQVQSLKTTVQGVSLTVHAIDGKTVKVEDSLQHLKAGLAGVETSANSLQDTLHGATGALTRSIGELAQEVGDVRLTISTGFADAKEVHGTTHESILTVAAKLENSTVAVEGLETALGASMKSIQDVASRVDTSIKNVDTGVKQMTATFGETLRDIDGTREHGLRNQEPRGGNRNLGGVSRFAYQTRPREDAGLPEGSL